MNVFAAIDLRAGAAVQLVGGDPAAERVRLPDAIAAAVRWRDHGFRHFHVVDLDAALGSGSNLDAVGAIARALKARTDARHPPGLLQVGGGLRDLDAVAGVLDMGADRAIVGTRAVEDPAWLEEAAAAFPARLVVAADVRDGVVVTRGWRRATGLAAADFLAGLGDLPLAAVLVTDVGREGREEGIDGRLFTALAAASTHPLIAAGGIAAAADLDTLRDAGAAGAVLGMALYTGRIEPADALEREDA
ncbi:MAG TPA: 1-(5-phosphoribosyl)-5-[(5-phosphoribosylamino)methylideneamino] imidazole-4-carboxamide isomerase [Longimicrobiales bacterium]|nr:1-(5-phosphoribosyl)-5-[(5-phosphoribosylamino)methylideneamino] imidazole-4-carboxamide isomerase [Longimicrobiales bacterium]